MDIAVTGMGIISALGTGVEATLSALLENRSGVRPGVRHLATRHDRFPVGEVPMGNGELAHMTGSGEPASRLRSVLLGIAALREALASARLDGGALDDCAFINATTVGGMDNTESVFTEIAAGNADVPTVTQLRFNDCGACTTLIAESAGRFGMATTISTACSSAANAIVTAANLIRCGYADIAVAGGTEALSRFHLNGFNALTVLNREVAEPFGGRSEGINLGEGAAYLVLESERSARARGVTPLAFLSGYGNACDAYHPTATSPEGTGPFMAMDEALRTASLRPEDIDYINAHGTGTSNNDSTEMTAMRRIWADALPPFSSTKPLTGHTTSASGSIEAVIAVLALRNGFIPGRPQERADLRRVLTNSFGFGGNDTSLIFGKTMER